MSGGRPSSYDPEYVKQAEKLCKLGATDEELAAFFEVSVRTIYSWAAREPEFLQALKAGKDACDERVVRSLYHRAVGYTHDAVKIFPPKTVDSSPVIVPYKEHVPPDTTAGIFWLKNRRRQEWRDRHEHEIGGVGDFERMTDVELADFIARESSQIGKGDPGAEAQGSKKAPNRSRRLN